MHSEIDYTKIEQLRERVLRVISILTAVNFAAAYGPFEYPAFEGALFAGEDILYGVADELSELIDPR